MAEYCLRDMAAKAGVGDMLEIASAAMTSEEIGNPVYPPARRMLARHGIDCTGKTARRMTTDDYHYYDMVIGMDEENRRHLMRLTNGDPDGKVSLLLEHTDATDTEHHDRDVADPWYTGDFDATWEDVERGCRALLSNLDA